MTNSNEQLLPCPLPWCGGLAETTEVPDHIGRLVDDDHGPTTVVGCSNENCMLHELGADIEQWNSRLFPTGPIEGPVTAEEFCAPRGTGFIKDASGKTIVGGGVRIPIDVINQIASALNSQHTTTELMGLTPERLKELTTPVDTTELSQKIFKLAFENTHLGDDGNIYLDWKPQDVQKLLSTHPFPNKESLAREILDSVGLWIDGDADTEPDRLYKSKLEQRDTRLNNILEILSRQPGVDVVKAFDTGVQCLREVCRQIMEGTPREILWQSKSPEIWMRMAANRLDMEDPFEASIKEQLQESESE